MKALVYTAPEEVVYRDEPAPDLGAAEVVLPLCDGIDRDSVMAEADRMAAAGYRVLAVARGPAGTEQGHEIDAEPPRGLGQSA